MFATLQEIIDEVIIELGLVNGSSVQQYTEPQIIANINTSFISLIEKRFWPHIMKATIHNLDGVSGTITDVNINIKKAADIEWIRYAPYESWCTVHNLHGREFVLGSPYSYDVRAWDDTTFATKLITVYPLDLNLPIKIRARRMPDPFVTGTEIVPFDKIAMAHFVTANLLSVDGMNPNSEQRQNVLFDQRYTDLIGHESQDVQYYGRQYSETFTVAP